MNSASKHARMRGVAAPSAGIVEQIQSSLRLKTITLRSWTTDRKKFVWKLINMQLIATFHTIPVCCTPWFEIGDAWPIFHQICEYTNIIDQICSISHILLSNLQIYQHLIYWICVPASMSSCDAGLAHISKFNRSICTHLRCSC